jgi:hypothetical protein
MKIQRLDVPGAEVCVLVEITLPGSLILLLNDCHLNPNRYETAVSICHPAFFNKLR